MSVRTIYRAMGQFELVCKSLADGMCEWNAGIQSKHVQRYAAGLINAVVVKSPFHLQDPFRNERSNQLFECGIHKINAFLLVYAELSDWPQLCILFALI